VRDRGLLGGDRPMVAVFCQGDREFQDNLH